MRYTTIIDITEMPAVYRNINARLLYLHMALRSGYHDDDRDIIALSIRAAAADIGLTVSAVRHALAVLERAGLIARYGNGWKVTKYILQQPISARPRSEKKKKELEIRQYEQQQQAEREAREEAQRRLLADERRRTGKTSYERMLEELEARAAAGDIEARQRLSFWKKVK